MLCSDDIDRTNELRRQLVLHIQYNNFVGVGNVEPRAVELVCRVTQSPKVGGVEGRNGNSKGVIGSCTNIVGPEFAVADPMHVVLTRVEQSPARVRGCSFMLGKGLVTVVSFTQPHWLRHVADVERSHVEASRLRPTQVGTVSDHQQIGGTAVGAHRDIGEAGDNFWI